MREKRRWMRRAVMQAWAIVLLFTWMPRWTPSNSVAAAPSSLAAVNPTVGVVPDEIVLVDGTLVEGQVVRRVLSNVVIRRAGGEEELIPLRLVKHVRRAGEVEPVSLSEILGEPVPDSGSVQDRRVADTRPRARASMLQLDATTEGTDAEMAIDQLWRKARVENADAVIVAVVNAELSLDTVESIGRRMSVMPADTHRVLVLGATSHPALALSSRADEVWWLAGETVRFQVLDPRAVARLEELMDDRIPAAAQKAMASQGKIDVDSEGRWIVDPRSGGATAIDADLAQRAGIAGRVIRRCDAFEIEAGLDETFDWEVESTSLSQEMERAAREEEAAGKQVAVAEALIQDIIASAAEVRAAAKAFDALYVPSKFHIRRIWSQDATWRNVDDKNRSLDAQARVKKAIRSLESHSRRLQGVAGRLSKDDPAGQRIFDCWRRIQEVVTALTPYRRSIDRNQPNTYEAERGRAMQLSIPNC